MKILYIALLFYTQLQAVIPTCDLVQSLITPDHQPTEALKRIAAATGIEGKYDLKKLIEVTQSRWKRPAESERDAIKPMFVEKTKELMSLFEEIGLTKEILPRNKNYTYGVIHGSIARTMLARFNFLENLIANKAVHIELLVLLTGKRAIGVADANEREFVSKYLKDVSSLSTETDIAKALLLQTDLFPHLKKIPLQLVDAAATAGNSRPHTVNTVIDWFATNPKPGSIIAVSTGPFGAYQDLIVRTTASEKFTLETCGPVDPRLTGDLLVGLCLDSLTRTLFQYDKWLTELKKLPVKEKVKS